jgi:hypothetical protein
VASKEHNSSPEVIVLLTTVVHVPEEGMVDGVVLLF